MKINISLCMAGRQFKGSVRAIREGGAGSATHHVRRPEVAAAGSAAAFLGSVRFLLLSSIHTLITVCTEGAYK